MPITNLWHVVWLKSFLTTLTTILTSSFLEREIAVVLLYKIYSVIKSVGKLKIGGGGGCKPQFTNSPPPKKQMQFPHTIRYRATISSAA